MCTCGYSYTEAILSITLILIHLHVGGIQSQPFLAIYFMMYARYSLSYSIHLILKKNMEKSTAYFNKNMCDNPAGINDCLLS